MFGTGIPIYFDYDYFLELIMFQTAELQSAPRKGATMKSQSCDRGSELPSMAAKMGR